MNVEKIINSVDFKEPLFANFIIEKYESLKINDPESAKKIETHVFTEDFILEIINSENSSLLISLFLHVPYENFSGIINVVADKYQKGEFSNIKSDTILKIIGKNSPELFNEIFEQLYKEIDNDKLNFFSLLEKINFLNLEDQKNILDKAIPRYSTLEEGQKESLEKFNFSFNLLKNAIRFQHPLTSQLAEEYISELSNGLENGKIELYEYCFKFNQLFFKDVFEVELFLLVYDRKIVHYPELLNCIYQGEDSGLELCKMFKFIEGDDLEPVENFIESNFDKIKDDNFKNVIKTLFYKKELFQSLDPIVYHMFLGVIISVIWKYDRDDKIDTAIFTEKNVTEFISFNLMDNPLLEFFKTFFENMSPRNSEKVLNNLFKKTIKKISESYDEDNDNTLITIIEIIDHIKQPNFIPMLFESINSASEYEIYELIGFSTKALTHLQNSTISYIDQHFKSFNDLDILTLLDIIKNVGTKEAEELLIKRFDHFMESSKIETLSACTTMVSEKAIDLIKTKTGKNQSSIDDFFVIVSMIRGDDDENIQKLLDSCRDRKNIELNIMNEFMSNKIRTSLKLELKCDSCGDISDYECKRIISGFDGSSYIADELTCINCNEISEFSLTSSSKLGIIAETTRVIGFKDKNVFEQSPIEILNGTIMGKQMGIPDGIELYKKNISKEPQNAEHYIGLGNIYKFVDKEKSAEKHYLKAIELSPSYLESYVSMASIENEKENFNEALNWLEKGRPYLNRPVVCKAITITPDEILNDYVDFHIELINITGSKIKQIDSSEINTSGKKVKKIGRNEKCPCNSGKKYKKCCMMKK